MVRSGCNHLTVQLLVAPEHRLATLSLDLDEKSKPVLGKLNFVIQVIQGTYCSDSLFCRIHFVKSLKVPKCENFHRTDFFYFYTIKSLWVGDFRAKIKIIFFEYLGGLFEVSFSKILC